jgi:hypothetical protein
MMYSNSPSYCFNGERREQGNGMRRLNYRKKGDEKLFPVEVQRASPLALSM